MENFTGTPVSYVTHQDRKTRSAADISLWCAFAAGAMIAMAAMYIAIISPITDQLDRVQNRLAELDKSLRAVAGQSGNVKATNNLLGLLAEQRQKSHIAAGALADIRYLHERLASQAPDVQRALVTLDSLDTINDRLLRSGPASRKRQLDRRGLRKPRQSTGRAATVGSPGPAGPRQPATVGPAGLHARRPGLAGGFAGR